MTIGGNTDARSFDNPCSAVTFIWAAGLETWTVEECSVAEEVGNEPEHIGSIFFILGDDSCMLSSCVALGIALVAANSREVRGNS